MQSKNHNTPQPVAQYLRCFIEKIDAAENGSSKNDRASKRKHTANNLNAEAQAIQEIGRPYEDYCLVFDTETTTDNRQALRFGIYAIYGIDPDTRVWLYGHGQLTREALDKQKEVGIFYNPSEISSDELSILQQFAQLHNLKIYEKDDFIRKVFYPWVYQRQALCIGHNLPFDLSRLATCWGEAKGKFYGGFWLTLCNCRSDDSCFDHPPVRVKSLGGKKALFDFRSQRKPSRKMNRYRGRFLDTATFGRALLGPGDASLAGMGKRFKASILKMEGDIEHGGPLTETYLDYALHDVKATWALYQAEREVYKKHGLTKEPWKIFSEASIGKAYLSDLGIPPFLKQHIEFPRTAIGRAMTAYYGGRTEVRIRLQSTEVIYTDFTSEYPTVNALLNIQELLLAEKIDVQPCLEEAKQLLATVNLNDLLEKQTWPLLRSFVKVIPDGDLLPVRTNYGDQCAATNIGLNYVDCGPAVWYCLADVVASNLLIGKEPNIVDAFKLVPKGRIQTKVWKLFDDERFTIDLEKDDLFARVIEMRADIKKQMKQLAPDDAEYLYLDGLQQALKLIANSTSYGVLVEINPDDSNDKNVPVHIYTDQCLSGKTKAIEEPGPYFMGPCGALIPAAGRLLLAMAEKLAAERGIDYVLCDTDSMAFAKPQGLEREIFRSKIKQICDCFKALSPYNNLSELLKIEDVNDFDGEPQPLYCIAVSAKRYALYNRTDTGLRIRKFSSHGTGGWLKPTAYKTITPEPCENVYKLGGHRWMFDLWYSAIQQIEQGKTQVSLHDLEFLFEPALTRVTVSTAQLLKRFKEISGIRPFSFMTMLPSLNQVELLWRLSNNFEEASDQPDNLFDLKGIPFYAPFGASYYAIRDQIRRMDNNELIMIEHKRLVECLVYYFSHGEAKAANPKGIGRLERQHLNIIEHVYIGKETHRIKDEISEESEGIVEYEETAAYARSGLAQLLKQWPMKECIRLTGIPRQTLYDVRNGAKPNPETRRKIYMHCVQKIQYL
ncbi:DNA polymerase domain-containing protein [Nitrosomonas sp. Nm166]|uniref:DNA polymerase domain-containing protein n=1 Tax=Nitrosomonas sp. Nm166 TaxID=1881054 RepID=UPI0008F2B1AE|nr:DNA polymerase domain-containing protein [Nitrosomonas sp. Nm166]SFF03391.1 DNA polymerase family B [Nitrosomonas sp. Nm166]